jgi:hypothetical protein
VSSGSIIMIAVVSLNVITCMFHILVKSVGYYLIIM